MVKGFTVQNYYFRLASLVVRMAIATCLVPQSPVITGFLPDIFRYSLVIMAIQAQVILFCPLELLVAFFTGRLDIGMTLYQLARDDHRIERVHFRVGCARNQAENNCQKA